MAKAFLANPSERGRINIVLGGGGARRLERMMGVRGAEKAMARTHQKLTGNSTTAQQTEDMANLTREKVTNIVFNPLSKLKAFLKEQMTTAIGMSDEEKRAITDILTEVPDEGLEVAISGLARDTATLTTTASTRAIFDVAGSLASGEMVREGFTR